MTESDRVRYFVIFLVAAFVFLGSFNTLKDIQMKYGLVFVRDVTYQGYVTPESVDFSKLDRFFSRRLAGPFKNSDVLFSLLFLVLVFSFGLTLDVFLRIIGRDRE